MKRNRHSPNENAKIVLETFRGGRKSQQKISSEKLEYRIATKGDVSIYRDYYPTLSLPCL